MKWSDPKIGTIVKLAALALALVAIAILAQLPLPTTPDAPAQLQEMYINTTKLDSHQINDILFLTGLVILFIIVRRATK